MCPFSITMVGSVISSLALPRNARQWLEVYAAFKTLQTVLQQQIFDIMHSGALEKRQYTMVQGVQTTME